MNAAFVRTSLAVLFDRYIADVIREIEAFPPGLLWRTPPGISNPAGVLAHHLVGNLNHFIGHGVGNSGYVRHRDREFADHTITHTELLEALRNTRSAVAQTLSNMTDGALASAPLVPLPSSLTDNAIVTTAELLLHLVYHTSYHLGQLNYLRRILVAEANA